MAVQFILGRSGTGKTSCCIEAIVNALREPGEQRLILLVPEQASYQAERSILANTAIAGYNRLHVLSFDRLQFLLLGRKTAKPALTWIGQQMVVQRLLRENANKLKVFGSSAALTGMGRQMSETISELHKQAHTPDDIDRLLNELGEDENSRLTALKLADIGLILKEYLRYVEDKFTDPDIQLVQACRAVAKADFIRGAKLWVDGFAGFTAAESAILTELLKAVTDAKIALCLDPSKRDPTNPSLGKPESAGLFSQIEQTYAALVEIVKNCKLELSKPAILSTPLRFACSPPLAHIERNIFELRSPKISAPDSVKIASAPNARAEVRFVARQILQLVKQRDYRHRDIAVIPSDIDRYQHYIRAYFDDYNIPFFIDRRKPLNQHPVVELICSALQVIIGGFCHDDIFSYLKTDLLPLPRCDIDRLENYCLEFGISAGDWQSGQDWRFAGEEDPHFEEKHINEIRRKVSGPLLTLRDRLRARDNAQKAVSADEVTRIVFDFLDSLRVRKKLGDWIEKATEVGDYTAADEHRQFYDKLITVFDELVGIFDGQKMTADEYLAILSSAFSQLTLAFIPPTLDQVLVGSIDRSRHPDLKAVFLIGATQRQFPAPVSLAGILTDEDRQAAGSAGFPLAPTARQKLVERQYLAYIAFTRPSEFLYVTYPLIDDRGSPEFRSQFIADLESLFEDLREESIAAEQISVENIHSKAELTDVLCTRLGRDASADSAPSSRDSLGELLEDIARDEQLAEVGSQVVSAVNYDNRARLDKSTIEKLFDQHLDSSATRLSTFAACPYQYFARYILELEERREFKFEPLDVGNFYHRALDALLKKMTAEKKDFATTQDDQLLKILREQIRELVQTNSFISNFAGRSPHNAFIIHEACDVLEDCVLAIAEMVRVGSFRPSRSEVAFGQVKDKIESIGEYKIGLADSRLLSLNGKIDRVDFADVDGKKTAIVFDYKRRNKSFNWSQFYYGLDMQLPIYMLAVRSATDAQTDVVGAFYMPVEVTPKQTALDELSSAAESFGYKAKGLFNGEFAPRLDRNASRESSFYNFYVTKDGQPYGSYDNRGALKPPDFEKILKFTEKKTVQLAEEILSGKIDVGPYRLGTQSPCSYCRYKPVCRFDWQINDYNFLPSVRKPAVLDEIGNS